MTITSYEDLSTWFRDNSRGDKKAPYWSLYAISYGDKDKVFAFEDKQEDLELSLERLIKNIRMGNNPSGQVYRIVQTDTPRGNNPVGHARVQIWENSGSAPVPAVAGIGGIGSGYIGEAQLQQEIQKAEERWEMKAKIARLEEQLENGNQEDVWEKIMMGVERIGQTPIGIALISKLMGTPIPPPNVYGTARPDTEDEPTDADNKFYDNMQEAAQKVGTDEYTLAMKINELVKTNPVLARQIFNS